uniref:Uncharacterized protein n=1 Tax=Anguilla anguilla TaxID=7936 RepID=A0A0E9SFC8_ANGAN
MWQLFEASLNPELRRPKKLA